MKQHTVVERELRSSAQLVAWTLVWVVSLALARFGPERLWHDEQVASWIAVAVCLVLGVGWIAAHARFLRGLDDLQRKINMDALAITLGVGLVAGFSYAVADHAGIIAAENNMGSIVTLPILMAVVYMVAILAGNMRYR